MHVFECRMLVSVQISYTTLCSIQRRLTVVIGQKESDLLLSAILALDHTYCILLLFGKRLFRLEISFFLQPVQWRS